MQPVDLKEGDHRNENGKNAETDINYVHKNQHFLTVVEKKNPVHWRRKRTRKEGGVRDEPSFPLAAQEAAVGVE